MQTNSISAAVASQHPVMLPARGNSGAAFAKNEPSPDVALKESGNTDALREQFTQFVGETFFGQMIKALRSAT
jgi:hypothetical protein